MENYVENAEGKMEIDEIGEDTGVVKVKIMKEYEETVINLLKDNWHEITGNPYDKVPPPFRNAATLIRRDVWGNLQKVS